MTHITACDNGEYFHELNTFDPNTGTIRIYDEISPHTVKAVSEFVNQFLASDLGSVMPTGDIRVKSIWLEIMSKGGCAKSGLAIYDILYNNVPEFIEIVTVGTGYVCSAASIIYCAGSKRVALPHTEFLIHRPTVSQVEGTKDEMETKGAYVMNVEKQMLEIYSTCIGKEKAEELQKRIYEGEVIIGTKEAMEMGFVTEITQRELPEPEPEKKPVKKPAPKKPTTKKTTQDTKTRTRKGK